MLLSAQKAFVCKLHLSGVRAREGVKKREGNKPVAEKNKEKVFEHKRRVGKTHRHRHKHTNNIPVASCASSFSLVTSHLSLSLSLSLSL
jgi:hypothetical protein